MNAIAKIHAAKSTREQEAEVTRAAHAAGLSPRFRLDTAPVAGRGNQWVVVDEHTESVEVVLGDWPAADWASIRPSC